MILTAEQTEAFKSCEVFSTCKDCAMGIVSGSRMCSMVMAEAYEELLRMVKEKADVHEGRFISQDEVSNASV